MSNTSGRCFRARRRTAERKQRQRERATRKIFEATAVKMGVTPEYVAKMSNAYLASTIRHRRRRAPIIDRPDTIVATVDMVLEIWWQAHKIMFNGDRQRLIKIGSSFSPANA